MDEEIYREARKRVKAKKGFYAHLSVYISVGLFFFFINLADGFYKEVWFFYPMLPWGVALAIHYFSVFGLPGTDGLTPEWEKREMEKEIRRMGYDPEAERYPYVDDPEEELDLREIQKERRDRGFKDDDFV